MKTGYHLPKLPTFQLVKYTQELVFPQTGILIFEPAPHIASKSLLFLPPSKIQALLKLMPSATTPTDCHLPILGNTPFICSWLTGFISSTILVTSHALYFFFKILFTGILFLESREEMRREGKKHLLVAAGKCHNWNQSQQPRFVSWPGIEGDRSPFGTTPNNWAILVRAQPLYFSKCYPHFPSNTHAGFSVPHPSLQGEVALLHTVRSNPSALAEWLSWLEHRPDTPRLWI